MRIFVLFILSLSPVLAVDPPVSASPSPLASGTADTVHFVIHARYRGAVEKDFKRIGTAELTTHEVGPSGFEVVAAATITHPQEDTKFEMDVRMTFELTGALLRISDKKNKFNAASQIYRYNIEQAVPFLHLVQALPIPGPREEPTRRFRIRGVEYDIRYRRGENDITAALMDGRHLLTTFYLEPVAGNRSRIRKFHVPGEGGVTVSFVAKKDGETEVTEIPAPGAAEPESPLPGSAPAATPGN